MRLSLTLILTCIPLFLAGHASAQENLQEPQGRINFEQAPGKAEKLELEAQEAAKAALENKSNLTEQEKALADLAAKLAQSEAEQASLAREIKALRTETENLASKTIEAAASIQELETSLTETEGELDRLAGTQNRIERSLIERRAVLTEVLASLQRMGRNPPPAIVIKPGDVLASVRSAVMLSSLVPEMRDEANILLNELEMLSTVKQKTTEKLANLQKTQEAHDKERKELDALISQKQALISQSDEKLGMERGTAETLAKQATDLRDLIATLTREAALSEQEAEARRAEAKLARQKLGDIQSFDITALEQSGNTRAIDTYTIPDTTIKRIDPLAPKGSQTAKLEPTVQAGKPFKRMIGSLSLPASGTLVGRYGEERDLGRSEGIRIATRSKGQVVTPTQGKVMFSGPFRTYGNMVLLDVGTNYHILLAGLETITVSRGQTLKQGEPVGKMGTGGIKFASNEDVGFTKKETSPILYVEFRQNGKAINPSPWWAD